MTLAICSHKNPLCSPVWVSLALFIHFALHTKLALSLSYFFFFSTDLCFSSSQIASSPSFIPFLFTWFFFLFRALSVFCFYALYSFCCLDLGRALVLASYCCWNVYNECFSFFFSRPASFVSAKSRICLCRLVNLITVVFIFCPYMNMSTPFTEILKDNIANFFLFRLFHVACCITEQGHFSICRSVGDIFFSPDSCLVSTHMRLLLVLGWTS